MTAGEAETFERCIVRNSIRMSKWDELAKEVNVAVVDLNVMKSKALGVLSGNR
jgi:hypothetical protein